MINPPELHLQIGTTLRDREYNYVWCFMGYVENKVSTELWFAHLRPSGEVWTYNAVHKETLFKKFPALETYVKQMEGAAA